MKRRDALALIENNMRPVQGARAVVPKRGPLIHAPGLKQRIVDPADAAQAVLDALARAGAITLEDE